MRTVVCTFLLTLMSLSLVLVGPAARGMVPSEARLVELCLDGVSQLVQVGADGQPVTPGQDCGTSHACCIVAGDPAVPDILGEVTVLLLQQGAAPADAGVPTRMIKFLLADPRGPPAAQSGRSDHMELPT